MADDIDMDKHDTSEACRKDSTCRARNSAATREAILDAARGCFSRQSYGQVGLRAIGADAGVDAALINRYFGSKEQLFANVLESCRKDPMAVVAGERSDFGERPARAVLQPAEDDPRQRDFIGLITHSAGSKEASMLVREHITRQFLQPLSAWLGSERAPAMAWLIAATLIGVKVMHDVHPPSDAVIELLARQLQTVVDAT